MVIAARGKAYVFDAGSFRIEREFTSTQRVHYAALSPDGRHCATHAWATRLIEVWDAADGRHLITIPGSATPCVGFSPDGRWLITGFEEEFIFWERGTWTRHKTVARGVTGGAHGRFAFTPDGSMMALSIGRGNVGLYDTETFELIATLEAPEVNAVSGLDFSRDGAQLVVSTAGQSIHRWDLRLIRGRLAELKLDFSRPPLPLVSAFPASIKLTVNAEP
jgi:WD40 repeat protein